MTEPVPRPNLRTLTGLRFVAALLVFGRHVEGLFAGSRMEGAARHVLYQGGIGVSFFFALSGFVLTWSRRPHDNRRSFYRRRFARIYPNYVVAWALGGVVAVWVGITVSVGIALTSLALVQAFVPNQSYFLGMDGVSWSLSCEAFFYALFPLLVVVLERVTRRVRLSVLLLALGGTVAMPWITVALIPPAHRLWWIYIFPPVRMLEFIAGIVVAFEVADGTWPRLRAAAVVPGVVVAYLAAGEAGLWRPQSLPVTSGYAAFTIVPIVLLLGVAAYADIDGRWSPFRHPWLVRLGEWSYAFYLLHFLVVLSYEKLIGTSYLGSVRAMLVSCGLLSVAIACSGLLHKLVERPWERRLRGAPPRPAGLAILSD